MISECLQFIFLKKMKISFEIVKIFNLKMKKFATKNFFQWLFFYHWPKKAYTPNIFSSFISTC